MARSIIILIWLVIAGGQVCGQSKPDYAQIETKIRDRLSPYYYPKIMGRYKSDDTTLTTQEMHYLYYGYFFQEDYSKHFTLKHIDSIKGMMHRGNLTETEKRRIIKFALEDLDDAPFSLNDLNALCTMYYELGEMANYKLGRYKFRTIGTVIMGSGDGRTPETGFHVLTVTDEYVMMSAWGMEVASYKIIDKPRCDYLVAKPNKQGIEGVYFDTDQMLAAFGRGQKRTSK